MDDKGKDVHLRFEDIIPYLPPDPPDVDQSPEVLKFLKDWKEKTHRQYVSRVNSLYDHFQAIWPNGNGIDYYIAYEHFSSLSEIDLFKKLEDPRAMKEVLQIISSKKKKKNISNSDQETSHEKSKKAKKESKEDIFDEIQYSSKKKKISKQWTENEISIFTKLLSKKNDLKTWKDVSSHFKNKTKNDCFSLYQKLLEKGQLSSKYAPKKEIISTLSPRIDLNEPLIKDIKGLFLEYNDWHSIVGPHLEARKEMARYSPLYGHMDLITGERMFLPTISEYGTVLDYSSWIKIISDTHLDPYEMKPIHNVRQIRIITKENYHEIESLIRHVGDKKIDDQM